MKKCFAALAAAAVSCVAVPALAGEYHHPRMDLAWDDSIGQAALTSVYGDGFTATWSSLSATTGKFSITLNETSPEAYTIVSTALRGTSAHQDKRPEFFLSQSTLAAKITLVDADTGNVISQSIANRQVREGAFAFQPPLGVDLLLQNVGKSGPSNLRLDYEYTYTPGFFAVASSDSSCASFSCMEIYRNDANWSLQLMAAVPEPGTYALMLGGIAVVAAAATRRKA